MKKILFPSLVILTFSTALMAAPPSMTGTWHVHINVMGNEGDAVCQFKQADTKLTGSCVNEQGTAAVTGTVQGTALTWSYNSEYQGSPLTLTYTATLGDLSKISGSVDVEPYAVTGDFTAEPVKKVQPAAAK
jgi:hypothetical protein